MVQKLEEKLIVGLAQRFLTALLAGTGALVSKAPACLSCLNSEPFCCQVARGD